MYDCIQIRSAPTAVFLSLLDFLFVGKIKDTVASKVVLLFFDVCPNSAENIAIMDTCCLEQGSEIVDAEMSVWTSMRFSTARRMLGQYLLARKWRITFPSSYSISPDITVRVSDVISVLLIECVVCNELERLTPEDETFLQGQSNTLEKECVLKPSEVFQMVVLTQGHV